jgi:hypothetical protein
LQYLENNGNIGFYRVGEVFKMRRRARDGNVEGALERAEYDAYDPHPVREHNSSFKSSPEREKEDSGNFATTDSMRRKARGDRHVHDAAWGQGAVRRGRDMPAQDKYSRRY